MSELFDLAFSGANFVPTFLLVFCVGYWLVVAVGLIDTSAIDIDLDLDFDTDVEVEADVDMEGDAQSNIEWLNQVLYFFNLGRVPFMLFLTFLSISMWVISMEANAFLGNSSWLIGLAILVPTFIVSLFISKFLTIPFVKLFQKLEDEPLTSEDAVGKICTVMTKVSSHGIAQGEVNIDGTFLTLYIKTREGIEIPSGDTALVIQHFEKDDYYLVEPYQ
ncbi:MAG: hypothetical protein ACFB10_11610 [Salibacteraceae bacterium]